MPRDVVKCEQDRLYCMRMSTLVRTFALFALILAATSCSAVYGATIAAVCTPGTLDNFIALGASGCEVGAFSVKNFSFSSQTGDSFVPVAASEVNVNAALVGGSIQVNFGSDRFDITGDQKISAFLDYTIDPQPPILDDMGFSFSSFSPVAPGFARLSADICAGGLLSNSCQGGAFARLDLADFGHGNPNNVLSALFKFPSPVRLVDVRLSLDMQANGASSQIDGIGSVTDVVPEPSTFATVFGAALLGGVAALRRRRRA
jgi:hypothetical protein